MNEFTISRSFFRGPRGGSSTLGCAHLVRARSPNNYTALFAHNHAWYSHLTYVNLPNRQVSEASIYLSSNEVLQEKEQLDSDLAVVTQLLVP